MIMASTTVSPASTSRPSSVIKDSPVAATNGNLNNKHKPSSNNSHTRQNNKVQPVVREPSDAEQSSNQSLLFLITNFVGLAAKVTLKTQDVFTGIFSGATLELQDPRYVLKMTKRLSHPSSYVGLGDDHIMTFAVADVVDLSVDNVRTDVLQQKLPNGNHPYLKFPVPSTNPNKGSSGAFRTDTDISGNQNTRQRELKPWQDSTETNVDLSLASASHTQGSWNQFETNERLYGVKTDYDENFYTTTIDRSDPSYKQRAAAAERVARQIEGSAATNSHQAEERGQATHSATDQDEEDKYSTVNRSYSPISSATNRWIPPAKRAPSAHSTVPGAPVDPAIISAQLVRPGSASKKSAKPVSPAQLASPVHSQKENIAPSTSKVNPSSIPPVEQQTMEPQNKSVLPSKQSQTSRFTAITPNNATETVERDVLNSFRTFSAHEKLRLKTQQQERQKLSAKQERELKLNDLKKFATNFKLKTEVPTDMLGILAKDQKKQEEIVKKSQREVEEQNSPKKPSLSSTDPLTPRSPVASRPDIQAAHANEKRFDRGQRTGPFPTKAERLQNQFQQGPGRPAQASFAQRHNHQQFVPRPIPAFNDNRTAQNLPLPTPTESPMTRSGSMSMQNAAAAAAAALKFNVSAVEFRPNPAASTFSPTTSSASPMTRKTSSQAKSPVKKSFFAEGRPGPIAEKRSIRDDFNPITRMKKQVEADNKTKDYLANGGIPQAYRTPPTWDCRAENENKSYIDVFDSASAMPSVSAAAIGPIPHQHQLPLHLQQGAHSVPPAHTPHQTPRHSYSQNSHGRDQQFDDHRMHASASNSSIYPSPRFQQNIMVQQSPMLGQVQPSFGQPVQYMQMGPNQQMPYYRHPQGGPMGASPNSHYMTPPMHQQMPMYPPGPNQAYSTPGNSQTPSNYPSPRGAPMMMHQNSQGHGPPFMYSSASQQGNQMYPQGNAAHMNMMRGGMPMQPQHSYNGSPQMQHQNFQHGRGPQPHYGGQFPQQQMPPQYAMAQQQPSPAAHVGEDGK